MSVHADPGATLLRVCPDISATPEVCMRSGSNGTTTAVAATNDTSLMDLSGRSINLVQVLPVQFAALNLSHNDIDSIPLMGHGPETLALLDLSFNSIPSYSRLALPSSITTLDLSYNNLTRMDVNSIDWSQFPKLSKLILRGNSITTIEGQRFPPSLDYLDLSDNPICRFDINPVTFFLFRKPGFVLMASMTPVAFQLSCASCPGTLVTGQGIALCVFEGTREHLLGQTQDYFMRYSIAITTITVAVIFVLWCRRYKQMRRDRAELSMRDTCTSSICAQYDGVPLQYRMSLSPRMPVPTEPEPTDTKARPLGPAPST
ncbi:hypothetical protein ACHHYP_00821 [Achlya hypogyna]|uniref:Uncharacterized protein n=1 Tax=Achlya hypogyna TaxID=1202772 RepID=A0A1V9ZAB9_ACHHY|nr:hypothetical protein ACHHYP_00821 [Achlya hypogyna]